MSYAREHQRQIQEPHYSTLQEMFRDSSALENWASLVLADRLLILPSTILVESDIYISGNGPCYSNLKHERTSRMLYNHTVQSEMYRDQKVLLQG